MSEFVKTTEKGYTLLTSKTDSEIVCPENDVTAQIQPDGAVKIRFLKNCKITKI